MSLSGLGVAMVTPFKEDLSIDVSALEVLTEDLVTSGVDFLVVMGTTGESVTLSLEERKTVLKTVLDKNNGRIPVVYGMGGNNTAALVDDFKSFDFAGVSAILSASPGYNKPTQEGIFQHYKALNAVTPLPIILYNVPGRTASNVEAKTCIRIAKELDQVIAVKEASGDLAQIIEIIKESPEDFSVFSGDDALTLPIMKAGGSGIISVIGNALPELYASMVHLAQENDYAKAEELDELVQPMIPLLFQEGNPAGVKALMQVNGKCTDVVRLPLIKASVALKQELKTALKGLSELA